VDAVEAALPVARRLAEAEHVEAVLVHVAALQSANPV
jgi:hypothetical protein